MKLSINTAYCQSLNQNEGQKWGQPVALVSLGLVGDVRSYGVEQLHAYLWLGTALFGNAN
jgi:hypothetical protein